MARRRKKSRRVCVRRKGRVTCGTLVSGATKKRKRRRSKRR